jgi:hypothetical protein
MAKAHNLIYRIVRLLIYIYIIAAFAWFELLVSNVHLLSSSECRDAAPVPHRQSTTRRGPTLPGFDASSCAPSATVVVYPARFLTLVVRFSVVGCHS